MSWDGRNLRRSNTDQRGRRGPGEGRAVKSGFVHPACLLSCWVRLTYRGTAMAWVVMSGFAQSCQGTDFPTDQEALG